MALTFRQLLDRLAEMECSSFASWDESQKAVRVSQVNAALLWAWKTDDPLFAFPFTVASATRTVTAGVVAIADLGEGSWCSLWEEDPRPEGARRCPVEVVTSHEGPRVQTAGLSSVFAFYRSACPQGTYAVSGTYASPSTIPNQLLEVVALRALMQMHVGRENWAAVNGLKAQYGDPRDVKDGMVVAARHSNLIWEEHAVALFTA